MKSVTRACGRAQNAIAYFIGQHFSPRSRFRINHVCVPHSKEIELRWRSAALRVSVDYKIESVPRDSYWFVLVGSVVGGVVVDVVRVAAAVPFRRNASAIFGLI